MSTKKEGFIVSRLRNSERAKGYAAFIRTDGRIWRKIKKNMIHHETKKAEKPDIF